MKFDLVAWVNGGCAVCSAPEREGLEAAHLKCWGSGYSEAMFEQIKDCMRSLMSSHSAPTTLLRHLSDFLANLPSGSLDRARNLECMQLRREIANSIVPADKKRNK